MKKLGRKILYADQIDGTTNTFKSTAELLVVPDLAESPDAWFFALHDKALKPLIYQERKAARFFAMDRDTDENVFMRKPIPLWRRRRSNAGYGFLANGIRKYRRRGRSKSGAAKGRAVSRLNAIRGESNVLYHGRSPRDD
ncbi:Mu-like prophage major head subunit gpT family protein [Paenibacillus melissococcoides]|uniref:Mu-like prophage major head subunit gpT family protein n=1 Tax=Paenibacillus melissococcoides TaxID=2912268 RepID=UPI0021C31F79|nr:Mu-like prophage major head subunit gpT family protein [Paenibacillus melissococcoides]CAH8721627.1 Mu-like prophage major head subunit gpT family protein [Paenibacillus melissococcoides]